MKSTRQITIELARHDGICTINVVRRRASVAELAHLGAEAVVVSSERPIDSQVRARVGAQGVKYAIDPVGGETGTQIYQSLNENGRMLVYGSLTGEPIRVGTDPRFILAGHRILEVFWLGAWLKEQNEADLHRFFEDIVALMREGVLGTVSARAFSLDDIGEAVTQAESTGRQGKVLLVPAKR
jgi:NADPH:quinone reductase-like Zn-dependent oxidoreductase